MNKLYNLLPKLSLWLLAAISVVITVVFFVGGGNEVEINGETWNAPTYTDLFIKWAYILGVIAIVLTLGFAIVSFIKTFINEPKKAVKSLVILVVFAAIFFISWSLGSEEKLDIIGYEGTDNQGVMAKFSDMCIFTAYILFAGTILSMLVTFIISKIK